MVGITSSREATSGFHLVKQMDKESEIRERRDVAFRFALSGSQQNLYWMKQLMEREQELQDYLAIKEGRVAKLKIEAKPALWDGESH